MPRNKEYMILSKVLVNHCFRNRAHFEDLHAGTFPSSKTGDYTDVKVVSPYGEIPWNELGRISDEEMKPLMKACVNAVFGLLEELQPKVDLNKIKTILRFQFPYNWDNPD
jgi:hypothetical protein